MTCRLRITHRWRSRKTLVLTVAPAAPTVILPLPAVYAPKHTKQNKKLINWLSLNQLFVSGLQILIPTRPTVIPMTTTMDDLRGIRRSNRRVRLGKVVVFFPFFLWLEFDRQMVIRFGLLVGQFVPYCVDITRLKMRSLQY